MSERKAACVIAETTKILKYNIHKLSISKDSFRNHRVEEISQKYTDINVMFQHNMPLLIHWDS